MQPCPVVWKGHNSHSWSRATKAWDSMSDVSCCGCGAYLYNNVYNLLYVSPLGDVLPAKVIGNVLSTTLNDSMIIRDTVREERVCLISLAE